MLTNYQEDTNRLYIHSTNLHTYIYLQDFQELFNQLLDPAAALHLFAELTYVCKVATQLPLCLVLLVLGRTLKESFVNNRFILRLLSYTSDLNDKPRFDTNDTVLT